MGDGAARERHTPYPLAQNRPRVHLDGCGWLTYLLRRPRWVPGRPDHRPHRCRRGNEVRVATPERRVRQAVWYRGAKLDAQASTGLSASEILIAHIEQIG